MKVEASLLEIIVSKLRKSGSVFAKDEARLWISEARSSEILSGWVDERVSGEPIEYILGWAAFCDGRFKIEPGVFVPRRRTEFLVQLAAERAQPGDIVVDLCCGTGAMNVQRRGGSEVAIWLAPGGY